MVLGEYRKKGGAQHKKGEYRKKTLHFTDSKYSIVEIFRDFDYHFLFDETREMIADVQKLCRNTPSISLDL